MCVCVYIYIGLLVFLEVSYTQEFWSTWQQFTVLQFQRFTCSMPAVIESACSRSGRQPQRAQTDDEAGEVHKQVGSICHHCQTSSKIPTCTQTRQQHIFTSNILSVQKQIQQPICSQSAVRVTHLRSRPPWRPDTLLKQCTSVSWQASFHALGPPGHGCCRDSAYHLSSHLRTYWKSKEH